MLWTRPVIADLVEQRLGVRFQPAWIGKLMRCQGFSLQRPVHHAHESAVRSDRHASTTWAPVGRTPVVDRTGQRHTVNMISALEPHGSIHFTVFTGRGDLSIDEKTKIQERRDRRGARRVPTDPRRCRFSGIP